VSPTGRLLASGRDADTFEYGAGLVLRRSRKGRSMVAEARTMEYVRSHGYPVPAVDQVSEDGTELVMERIDGPSMVEAISRSPWTVRHQGRTLADLHRRLHELQPPDFLRSADIGSGTSIVHLDLHPLNVVIGAGGPVVIDWTNARIGDPDIDVALAWLLMSAGEVPGKGPMAKALGVGRSLLVGGFIGGFDRRKLVDVLRRTVEWKQEDPNMSAKEVDRMWSAVRRAEQRWG
jgi:aminoglycoside phosphotransferase (APT) family kinase protein